eukprot:5828972-Amphidinium_carterae.1
MKKSDKCPCEQVSIMLEGYSGVVPSSSDFKSRHLRGSILHPHPLPTQVRKKLVLSFFTATCFFLGCVTVIVKQWQSQVDIMQGNDWYTLCEQTKSSNPVSLPVPDLPCRGL